MFTRQHHRLSGALWLAAFAACGGHTLDVGSTDRDAASDRGGDASPEIPAGNSWTGTLENAQFVDGSSLLRMTVAVDAVGIATGTVLLGDGALLQPPTDPNVGYPVGVQFQNYGPLGFFEGFPYTIDDGVRTGDRLTFQIAEFDVWARWCALQTMTYPEFATDAGMLVDYRCAPNSTNPVTGPDGGQTMIDVAKWWLCCVDTPCTCTAGGCQVKTPSPLSVVFDLSIVGSTADGTISGALGDHAVHFTRDPVTDP